MSDSQGGQPSAVVHDSDMSIVCDVDMTVSFGTRSYGDYGDSISNKHKLT